MKTVEDINKQTQRELHELNDKWKLRMIHLAILCAGILFAYAIIVQSN